MADIIRAGMIGTDTSHCMAFSNMLHNDKDPNHVPGVRIVAAYPSFSPDVESSVTRVDAIKKELNEKWGVKIVDSIDKLLEQVDVVLIESVDGRRHLPELRPVVEAGKPVFVDKPFAASFKDAREMVRLCREHKVPCFGGSSLRFDSNVRNARAGGDNGAILGCDAFSPAHLHESNPGLFWYGCHGVEILYTLMGRGCRAVQCTSTPDGELAVGEWADGRIGSMRGIRKGKGGYGAAVLYEKGPMKMFTAAGDYYKGQMQALVKFFQTGEAPVELEESLELCAFMDAAWRSAKADGEEMKLEL